MTATTNTREFTDSIVTLRDVDWETNERLRSADGNRGVRMTYDHVYRLMDKAYVQVQNSVSLCEFPFEQALKILELRYEVDETGLVRRFWDSDF